MQIVIDIDDNLYTRLFDNGDEYVADMRRACVAIRKGIVLPKGHGRLIDADEFHRTLEDMPIRDNDKWFNWLQKACNRLAEALTIIEADNTRDCNNCAYSDRGRCAGTEVCHECMWSNKFIEADKESEV